MQKTTDFTKGDIYFPLLKFASFLMMAMFIQTLYGAVDILVVSLYATAADVSAAATGGQVIFTLQQFVVAFSVGITISIGQKIGEGHIEECGKIIETALFIFGIFSFIISLILLIFAEDIARLMNAPSEALKGSAQYIFICGAGTIFVVSYNLLGAIFRGLGDSVTPLITVAIACVINIVLDLIFVIVLEMGVVGVAFATTLAQAISVIISLIIIKRREMPFDFSIKNIKFHKEEGKKIFLIGSPMGLQDLLVGFSFIVVTSIVNSLGLVASAGMGLASRLIGFLMLLPSSLAQSIGTVTAQNYGAKSIARAKKALLYGISTAFCLSSLLSYVGIFHGDIILSFFSNDPLIISAAWEAIRVYSIEILLTSFLFCLIGFCIGCGKTPFVMMQGIFGAFCLRIPCSYYFSIQENASLFTISIATPIATAVQICICLIFYYFLTRKLKNEGF